jgi:hypothetical protein
MAGALLALFPVLLIFDSRFAVAALGLAIVLLIRKRTTNAGRG